MKILVAVLAAWIAVSLGLGAQKPGNVEAGSVEPGAPRFEVPVPSEFVGPEAGAATPGDVANIGPTRAAPPSFADRLLAGEVSRPRTRSLPGVGEEVMMKASPAVPYLFNPKYRSIGAGSFVLDGTYIITNQHVAREKGLDILFALEPEPGKKINMKDPARAGIARTVAVDYANDLALLRVVSGPKAPAILKFGKAADVRKGKKVFAIGHPQGIPWTFSEGAVSNLLYNHAYRYRGDPRPRVAKKVILTHTPIDPGSSGGPLIDSEARLVAVNFSSKKEVQISNYAVALETVEAFVAAHKNDPIPKGAAAKPQAGRFTRNPKMVRIYRIFASSDPNEATAETSGKPIIFQKFYLYAYATFGKEFVDKGHRFSCVAMVARYDESTRKWVTIKQYKPESYALKYDKMWYRRKIELPMKMPPGKYKILCGVFVGRFCAVADRHIQVAP